MLMDRSQKNWMIFSAGVLLAAALYYTVYYRGSFHMGGNGPSGGSWTGLTYGVVGFAMMIFCGLLGLRRRVRIWRLGRAQTWLKAHIWLGLLAFPIIYMHGGLSMGAGLTFWMMILFVIVEVSGILGVILQNTIPRYMLGRLPAECTFEQIPQVIGVLRSNADKLIGNVCGDLGLQIETEQELPGGGGQASVKAAGKVKGRIVKAKKKDSGPIEGSGPLKTFYLNEVRPYLDRTLVGTSRIATPQGTMALFEHARTLLPEVLHDELGDLQAICDERREIAMQQRLHFWLHAWLFFHVPLSYALLVLSTFHAIQATLKY